MTLFKVTFIGRDMGAIGVYNRFEVLRVANSKEDAVNSLYLDYDLKMYPNGDNVKIIGGQHDYTFMGNETEIVEPINKNKVYIITKQKECVR